jgi:Skp family chaperone for outer membrane proteins
MQAVKHANFNLFHVGVVLYAMLAFLLLAAGPSAAQQSMSGKSGKAMMQAQKKAKKYSQKLNTIQRQALKNNPELEKQRQAFNAMVRKKMSQMVSEDASKQEKMNAYMKLRNDKELQQKKQAFQKNLSQAMQKENPKTQEYIRKFEQARQQMRQQQMRLQKKGGAGQQ